MKKILILALIPICVFALEFVLKEGEIVTGDLICENKGKLTVKSGSETVSFFKKSIKIYNGEDISGIREFVIGDSLILKNKNEIIFIVETSDAARIRLRQILPEGGEVLIDEKSGVSGEHIRFDVPDGVFYESVEYTRGDQKYYINSAPFEIVNKCDKFSKREISLRGAIGENIPKLKSDEVKFKRDGE
jgi:hypothetical protein